MKLTFLGAAGEVTGSSYLLEASGVRFLVDCGMFQGGREADDKNRARFAFDPRKLGFVLLTHAHIDHSGLLPRLIAEGFSGPIYATAATCDLLEVMLIDSAHIQEKEAEWRREARSRERPPIYSTKDALRTLKQLRPIAYNDELHPHASVRCVFRDAGHILGSAIIEAWVTDGASTVKGVFSGDIGPPARPLVRDPSPITEADFLLVESTYGNRLHRPMEQTLDELTHAITDTLKKKHGNVIVPAFAVGRAQDMLYLLTSLYKQDRLPPMNIYVDSPMAMKATEITLKHMAILDRDASELLAWARHHPNEKGDGIKINFVQDVEESIALHQVKSGAIIISASGMCDAGRIKHHLRHNLGRRDSTIIITGFQAAGTLGRRIVDGEKEVRIFGVPVPVRADIYTIGGLSAHADQAALLGWLAHFKHAPRHTFVVHGEAQTANDFAALASKQLQWDRDSVRVPKAHDCVEI